MSKPVTEVQSAVTREFHLNVETEDAAGNPVTRTWRLVLDYRAIAIVQREINRDLKRMDGWKDLSSSEVPVIVHACLRRYHPEVTLDEVLDNLNTAAQIPLENALFELAFPGAMEAWAKQKAQEKSTGATASPNAEMATA
jgi:hypothetical protein